MPESTGGELLVVSDVSLTMLVPSNQYRSPLDMFVPYKRYRHLYPHTGA